LKIDDVFEHDFRKRLDESIRIDREPTTEYRLELLEQYHVTEDAGHFLQEFFERLRGHTENMRQGWNNWLYGYYGSGKSHLLTVVALLTDADWIDQVGQHRVWEHFADGNRGLSELEETWRALHDEFYLVPLSVNLLKHQGQSEQGFGEIVLSAAYERQGYSPRLEVAFFENWYQQFHDKDEWAKQARKALDEAGVSNAPFDDAWKEGVQQYAVLSDVVLPRLFKEVVPGDEVDGLRDVVIRDLRPEVVARELETWRSKLAADRDKQAKLVLLLDEISLFIGTRYNLLTELNSLAENIDEIGRGNILSVVTAQEKIADVRTDYVPKAVSFGILSDRYPYQYILPSSHVGQIVQRRLLRKTEKGREWVVDNIVKKEVSPADAFVYSNVVQNTAPRLDSIVDSEFVAYFPLLPYHPPLFLEILANLRGHNSERAKSVFSGTARAVLAIVKDLLEVWEENDDCGLDEIINLVDFFDIIRPELETIIGDRLETIVAIEREVHERTLEALDVDVAKVVLLLSYAAKHIPLNANNIAASILRDTRIDIDRFANEVSNSLFRLKAYIRPESEAGLRFTVPDERDILHRAEEFEAAPDWGEITRILFEHAWSDVLDKLHLTLTLPFPGTDERCEVTYHFSIDGIDAERTYGADDGLDVPIAIRGLLPPEAADLAVSPKQKVLQWLMVDKDLKGVRSRLISWASLLQASEESSHVPESIQKDLGGGKEVVVEAIRALLIEGSHRVEAASGFKSADAAIQALLAKKYPEPFHPAMLAVNQTSLSELKDLGVFDALPDWANKIQIPNADPTTARTPIETKFRAAAAQTLKKKGELTVHRLLEFIVEEEPLYERAKPAVIATIWGLCRSPETRFRVVGSDGSPVEEDVLLDMTSWHETRLQFLDSSEPGGIRIELEKIPTVSADQTLGEMFQQWRRHLQSLRQRLKALLQEVELKTRQVRQSEPRALLSRFVAELQNEQDGLNSISDKLKQQNTDWASLADRTVEVTEWIDEARQTWDQRKSNLFEYELLLTIEDVNFDWLDESIISALGALRKEVYHARSLEWWTRLGWEELTDRLTSLSSARTGVRQAWTAHCEEGDRLHLLRLLEANPWFESIDGFHTLKQVQEEFESTYLRPLSLFQRHFGRLHHSMEALSKPDIDKLTPAINTIRGLAGDTSEPTASIAALQDKWTHFQQVIGEYRPGDVAGVGMWPGDQPGLREVLRQLILDAPEADKSKPFVVENTDKGVVIR